MKLPPLHALHAFDTVARLGGVRAAAEALYVTPAAVTQQLRVLELHFGLSLVERRGRGIALTEAGRSLHLETSKHLHAIASASNALKPQVSQVRVTAAHGVAVHWLVPRLHAFSQAHPMIDVLIDANPQVQDMRAGAWDLALREGEGHYPGHQSELLFSIDVVPVASPDYVRRELRDQPPQFRNARLLHDVGNLWWRRWFAPSDAGTTDLSRGLSFSNTALVIAAAVEGQGVGLVPSFLIRQEIEAGKLLSLSSEPLVTGVGVHAVWPERVTPASPAALAFRRWVIDEAAADALMRRHED